MTNDEHAMTPEQLAKLDAEIAKLMACTAKLNADTVKISSETRWYPLFLGTGLVGAVAAMLVAMIKLLGI